MNFQIYTMYVNRKDLLLRALASIGEYQEQVVVLDNSPEQRLQLEDFPGEILVPPVPLFCSQSYNYIVKLAKERKQDVFAIMHSDAEASTAVMRHLLEYAEQLNRAGRRWGVLFTNYDVLCLMNTPVVGDFRWDPYLPLYYTDADYYYRLRVEGIELLETGCSVEHQEGGSTTLHADPALHLFVQTNYPAWRHYYMLKWGGERGEEQFTSPFNW